VGRNIAATVEALKETEVLGGEVIEAKFYENIDEKRRNSDHRNNYGLRSISCVGGLRIYRM
jgi:hypothetical protein